MMTVGATRCCISNACLRLLFITLLYIVDDWSLGIHALLSPTPPAKSAVRVHRQPIACSCSCLTAHTLTTALESVWYERHKADSPYYNHVTWLDLAETSKGCDNLNQDNVRSNGDDEDHDASATSKASLESMPLYPLPAVYLPTQTSVNHTLVNIEPQNLQMAQDLFRAHRTARSSLQVVNGTSKSVQNEDENTARSDWDSRPPPDDDLGLGRFCVVLRAVDTGRIASVGTVLKIIEADVQLRYGASSSTAAPAAGQPWDSYDHADIARIKLTCQAEALVEVVEIENPQAFSRENRIRKSNEYLRAKVRPLNVATAIGPSAGSSVSSLVNKLDEIMSDYRTVKTVYQLELGSDDFPPGLLGDLGNNLRFVPLPHDDDDVTEANFERTFWELAQEWQSVCLTLRQGEQALLATERNELMIDAASAKGGPLNLPVHLEDLPLATRQEVQELEVKAQQRHLDLELDPILDFQVLIGLRTWSSQVDWLGQLVARERRRLEAIASGQR